MSRAIWKGSIGLGMVSVPVSASKATDDPSSGIAMNLLHADCKTQHQQKKWCPKCEKELTQAELVKGYKEGDGFIVLTQDEIDNIKPESSHTINIDSVVDASAIDDLYFANPYYLAPQAAGLGKPFAIVREALRGKVAIGVWTNYGRDHLVGIRPKGNGLVMHVLRQKGEVRPIEETGGLSFAEGIEINPKELKLAQALIAQYEGEFDPNLYEDSYKKELLALIDAKRSGQEIAAPAPRQERPALDFMAALEKSLAAGKPQKKRQAKVEEPVKAKKRKSA